MIFKKKIKIVHITTSVHGGAGIAAYRLHCAQLKYGIDSIFLSTDSNADGKLRSHFQLSNARIELGIYKKIKERLKELFFLKIFFTRNNVNKSFLKIRSSLNCEITSLPFSLYDILDQPSVKSADIIHLHWVGEILDYPTFFKNNSKPVVWTLHDMNPILGLFHYAEDENLNKKYSERVDKIVKKIKLKSILNRKFPLIVIAPSYWLTKVAGNSKIFMNNNPACIHNTLNQNCFNVQDDINELKLRLLIPTTNKVLLFIAQNVAERRKGLSILIESLKKLSYKDLTLLVIGDAFEFILPQIDIKLLGRISDEETLRDYYSVSDAFIIPSIEDNLPNVLLESMMCGVPVISFDIGGMAEIIEDGFNGLKAKAISADGLAKTINIFFEIRNSFDRNAIRDYALSKFSERIIVDKYWKVYSSLMH